VFDRKFVRDRLQIAPRVVSSPKQNIIPDKGVSSIPSLTDPTSKGQPNSPTMNSKSLQDTRSYHNSRSVVAVDVRDEVHELSFVTIPLLFVAQTAEISDAKSVAAIAETAAAIKDVTSKEPTAKFEIEGHSSAQGTNELSESLSAARAKRVYDELITRHGIPHSTLSSQGFGEIFAQHPTGTEAQMRLDQRVLIVRRQ